MSKSKSQPSHKSASIELGKLSLNPRITVANIRRLKREGGLDFATQDPQPMLDFAVDPDTVVTSVYYLFKDQFDEVAMTEDDFAEVCGPEQIEALRAEVTQQMRSFSAFWRILSTEMESLQDGNIGPLMEKLGRNQEASGPSS